MEAEWLHLVVRLSAQSALEWESDFALVEAEQHALVRTGRWISGPSDLMAVLGIAGNELSHSAVLAWLLAPAHRHGWGDAVLRALATTLWPEDLFPDGPVVVERERVDPVGIGTRADVLAWVGVRVRLFVIENKVFAPESLAQCELLYESWRDQATDVRFALLSRTGAPPTSVLTDEARTAWRSFSHRQLADIVDALIQERPPVDDLAASTIRQYLATLRRYVA